MKYIDVTLRDGGHQHGFNWPLEFVKRYLESLNLFPEIEFVELGYWKQSDKFEDIVDFSRARLTLSCRMKPTSLFKCSTKKTPRFFEFDQKHINSL